ncbi:MAG: TSUP family transporter [Streptosporangiaceae bacterium]
MKNAVSGMANAMAAVCFALFGDVRWALVAPLAAGFLAGGWIGPKIARKVPAGPFRVVVSMCGVGLAVKLGISAYR